MKMSKGRWWQQFQNLNFNLTKYNIWHECCNNKFPKGLSKHTTVQHIRSYTILWMFMYIHICTVYNWKIVINFDNIQWNKFWQKIGKIVFEKKKLQSVRTYQLKPRRLSTFVKVETLDETFSRVFTSSSVRRKIFLQRRKRHFTLWCTTFLSYSLVDADQMHHTGEVFKTLLIFG